eukprot:UC1_evm2s1671
MSAAATPLLRMRRWASSSNMSLFLTRVPTLAADNQPISVCNPRAPLSHFASAPAQWRRQCLLLLRWRSTTATTTTTTSNPPPDDQVVDAANNTTNLIITSNPFGIKADDKGWETRVGLEVHAQIRTHTKAFSRGKVAFAAPPNTLVAAWDAATPGTLPVLNQACVEAGVRTALALEARINPVSTFDRKHYYYQDLPAGYQITQQVKPLAEDGRLCIGGLNAINGASLTHSGGGSSGSGSRRDSGDSGSSISSSSNGDDSKQQQQQQQRQKKKKRKNMKNQQPEFQKEMQKQEEREGEGERYIGIERLHLEHDSAKSIHTAPECTLVDLNRAGTGLVEIVTRPDMSSGAEAAAFVRELIGVLEALGTCDCNLAQGSLRVDANVSVHHTKVPGAGVRTEVKNVNGLRFLARAIEYEATRHREALALGLPLVSETRTFDAATGTTIAMRSKEAAADYRFMPEPDLPPLRITPEYLACQRDAVDAVSFPREEVARLRRVFGLRPNDARTLQQEPGGLAYVTAAVDAFGNAAAAVVSVAQDYSNSDREGKGEVDAIDITQQ